jgi:hypothetical protein
MLCRYGRASLTPPVRSEGFREIARFAPFLQRTARMTVGRSPYMFVRLKGQPNIHVVTVRRTRVETSAWRRGIYAEVSDFREAHRESAAAAAILRSLQEQRAVRRKSAVVAARRLTRQNRRTVP